MDRRSFLKSTTAGMAFALAAKPARAAGSQPNILWIVSEDNSPYLGCYGDPQAQTPRLDQLAAEGLRYKNAFANAPVCSAARSTLITGMYATTLGIHNHRSRVDIPSSFKYYPQYLRDAGYYCTNNAKQDYNITGDGAKSWHESSNQAHYKNRPASAPFFAVFNIGTSHEGQLQYKIVEERRKSGALPPKPRIAPEDVKFPPYHPDTPIVRRDWSVYYDNVTLMDQEAGALLDELADAGLAEDTIVFYYGDHGGALPRGKRNIHDSGTRVPFIVRIPEKFANLAPAKPGEWVEQPVSFVDFPATIFSLAGAEIPDYLDGRAFLGERAAAPREHVFLFRGRMDERYDTVRAVRDTRYRYIQNYSPHRPWGQHYSYPFEVMPMMQSWYDAHKAGKCNAVQARYWEQKPPVEFYDTKTDPYEINNIANDPSHAARIAAMRDTLREYIRSTRDAGLIPEGMYERLAGDKTIYDYARSDAYPIERVMDMAELASAKDPKNVEALVQACGDAHPIIRYWAATGCLILQDKAAPAKATLLGLLGDDWDDVRIVAAEALGYLGATEQALTALTPYIKNGNGYLTLAAMNTLDFMHEAGHVTKERIRGLLDGVKLDDNSVRISNYLLS